MGIDIRLPIGLMFTVFGVMLTVYGRISNPAIYARSLGININSMWGVVLLVFGTIMLALGARSHRQAMGGEPKCQAIADREHGDR
jgi:hypothetical protein